MRYALLVYNTDESGYDRLTDAESAQMARQHADFAQLLRDASAYDSTLELADAAVATSVRHRPEGKIVIDGPYAESREVLGGFYLIDAADDDAAMTYAKQLPTRPGDIVEVRCQMVDDDDEGQG